MPELPEVETVCAGLEPYIIGRKIHHVETMRPKLRIDFPHDFSEKLEHKQIKYIKRRSKYILIGLSNDNILVVHLGMSGKFTISDTLPENLKKHDHVTITLDNGTTLIYNDARRFGLMTIIEEAKIEEHKLFVHLGVEPLTPTFTAQYLYNELQKKTVPIKNSIMEGKIVVGVGNIYACESLFRSKISPISKSSNISLKQCSLLVKNIKEILQEAIKSGGSTLRDYVQASGELGYFQHNFAVYGRGGECCIDCSAPIERIKQQGRSTFFCPICQK